MESIDFCRSAPSGLAGQRARAHSLADCARRRPCSAHSGLRGSAAARAVEMRAKTRTQIRFGPLARAIDTPQSLFIYMFEGALEQHPIEVDPALYNRIGFDGGFGIARICARPTNRRFLAPLRGRHLARSATIVGARTRRISGKGPNSYRRPCCHPGCSHQAKRSHRRHGSASDRY